MCKLLDALGARMRLKLLTFYDVSRLLLLSEGPFLWIQRCRLTERNILVNTSFSFSFVHNPYFIIPCSFNHQ
jgi:hypothetical protein